ncbi:ferredoxin C 2, chloroplastic [Apium graveolens]|uniref:ferredoxin C 2, chloroplastic n=1 Tax=Apium graveolens TaxID=4045 RepID=UPI003D7C074D
MDAQALCNVCTPFHRKPTLFRSPIAFSNSLKFRRKMTVTSELQTTTPTPSVNGAYSQSVRTHKVTVNDRQRGLVHEFVVPEDQYILHTAEDQDISLPFACRHGCCTSCAVRIKSGEIRQPEALGISAELKAKGYALLCVGFPTSDIEVETQDEDEVYWLQFGRYFARGPIERDDYALELAMGDE